MIAGYKSPTVRDDPAQGVRTGLDAAWPPDVARACAVLTASAPVGVRQQVRRELYTSLADRGNGTPDLDDAERVWTDVKSRLFARAGER